MRQPKQYVDAKSGAASGVAAGAGNSIVTALNNAATTTTLNGYVKKAGDTMTGALTLSGDPTAAMQATTKQYVDAADATKVSKAGDTMTGSLNIGIAGTGSGAVINCTNASNTNEALFVSTNGAGGPNLTGGAANFQITNPASTARALTVGTRGTGHAFIVDHGGATGTDSGRPSSIAVFTDGGGFVARIDRTGKGFFNGGVQNSGADVAEAFTVDGKPADYEPGDVLVVSKKADRQVAKSSEPYSTRVAGVHATKPGVLLTERGIDEKLDDTVPLGIAGVIPTKVSGENGRIKRGDLLVSSGTPGHAMKGTDKNRLVAAVIGKALENFDEDGTAVIKVLVNVK